MNQKEKNILQTVAAKSLPITDNELRILRQLFRDKLDREDKTQTLWCKENNIKDSTLSNSLNGHIVSKPTLSLVARYVLDDTWN